MKVYNTFGFSDSWYTFSGSTCSFYWLDFLILQKKRDKIIILTDVLGKKNNYTPNRRECMEYELPIGCHNDKNMFKF